MSIDKTTKVDGVHIYQNELSQTQQDSTVEIDLTGNQQLSQNQMALLEHFGSKFRGENQEAIEAEKKKLEAMSPEDRQAYMNELFEKSESILEKVKKENSLYGRWKKQWEEDFQDVNSVGSFMKAVVNRTRRGFKMFDAFSTDVVKYPIKQGAAKIDEILEDKDPKSVALKMWELTKGVGDVADYCTSAEGLWLMAATAVGLEALGAGGAAVAGLKGELAVKSVIQTGFTGYGVYEAGSGIKGALTADTPEEAREAGQKIATGALFTYGGVKMTKTLKSLNNKIPANPIELKTMPYSELKANIQEVFNEAFDQMGIPKEARPTLNIIDNIKYKSKPEIEQMALEYVNKHIPDGSAKIRELKIFKEADNPMNMTADEIIAKIKTAVNRTPNAKIYDGEYIEMRGEGRVGGGGGYHSGPHAISFTAKNYRNNMFKTVEEVIVHEAEHARNAILRHRLSREEAQSIIKDLLIDKITNSEDGMFIRGGRSGLMKAPNMSAKFKQQFAKFAEENLYNEKAATLDKDLDKIELLKYNLKENPAYAAKMEAEYLEAVSRFSDIETKLINMLRDNPDFITENGGTIESALEVITDYTHSHVKRYVYYSDTKIPQIDKIKFPELSPNEHAEAVQSLINDVASSEGNAIITMGKSLSKVPTELFNQYYLFSPEEVMARNTAARFEKAKLESQPTTTSNKQRMEVLDFEIEYNRVGVEYYDLYTKSLENPYDIKLQTQLKTLGEKFQKLDLKRRQYGLANVKMEYLYEFNPIWETGMIVIPYSSDYNQ